MITLALISLCATNRNAFRVFLLLAVVVSLGLTGCQSLTSLNPFPLRNDGKMARQWLNGGLDALEKGKLNQAERYLARASEIEPANTEIRSHYARALSEQGEYEKAIEELNLALEHKPNPATRVELGRLYLNNRQWLPARHQAEIALREQRQSPEAWVLKGDVELAKGNLQTGLAHYHRALGFQPNWPEVQIKIAETYQRMNQPKRSLSVVENLLSQYPSNQLPEAAMVVKGVALMEMKQHSEAIDVLQDASEVPDATQQVFFRLGQAQLLAGQVSQARATLKRGQQKFPGNRKWQQLASQLESATAHVAVNY